jgi:L-ribulose-5-phosphate 3-epimerase UlaE
MGKSETIQKFRDKLQKMASRAGDTGATLTFEADFDYLDSIANALVKEACQG